MRGHSLKILIVVALAVLASCTGYKSFRQAQVAEELGDWDQAVLHYLELVQEDPGNLAYRAGLLRSKVRASQDHFEKGKKYQQAGVLDQALREYQQAVQLDPTNQYAQVELSKLRDEIVAQQAGRQSTLSLEEMKDRTKGRLPQPPVLNPRSTEPISLDFPEPVSVLDIYRALGKAFGINILFDPNLRQESIAIELTDVTAQEALEILMRSVGHFYKVLDEHSIIIAADTPQKRRTYEDLVIQTFFLSNAEVKDMMTMLRSLVGAKNIAANDQLNAIVLRDTADKVKVAEQIILTNDKSRGEVVVDVELLQINTTRLQELGLRLSDYFVTQELQPNPISLNEVEFINQSNWLLTIPSFIYNFVKDTTDAELLARPQLRISDGEQANLVIGDRVPIPVTTFNSSQTIGGNIVPITSFQYQDVGIRIDLEPRIHHNQEITLKVTVEVSNLAGFVEGSGGQQQPIIGTRTIESTIRLKDGETNFMAGLIREDETTSDTGVPGLSEIPAIGRLFSHKTSSKQRTDLVLTLTPHIIRASDITEGDLLPIWVGTEANITFRGDSPRVESDAEGPFEGEEESQEQIRELIRQRIQNLPRGLRDAAEGEEAPAEEAQPGVELAPAAPPEDLFDEEEDEEEEPPAGGFATISSNALTARSVPLGRASSAGGRSAPGVGGASAGWLRVVPAALSETAPDDAAAGAAIFVWMSPEAAVVRPGQAFEVEVRASARRPVSHLPMALRFDPAVLAVEGVTGGEFLGGGGQAQVIADTSRPGQVLLGASRLGRRQGITGTGTVARLRLRAVAEGATRLEVATVEALDETLRPAGSLGKASALVQVDLHARPVVLPRERRPDRG